MSSYRILPASDPTPVSALPHDLQHGPVLQVSQFNSNLDRLDSWNSAQDNLRLNLKRDIYGMHAPMRLLMERKLVAPNPHMSVLPRSNLHLDILMGRDEAIEPVDVFGGMETSLPLDIHKDMEKKWRL
ncbi:hypothetical protein AX14_000075 [Amanita brunnescens Koide BX004]|nr:hypothetical protein AX14_000075 [Amanita brunnescens Koide BX004]